MCKIYSQLEDVQKYLRDCSVLVFDVILHGIHRKENTTDPK